MLGKRPKWLQQETLWKCQQLHELSPQREGISFASTSTLPLMCGLCVGLLLRLSMGIISCGKGRAAQIAPRPTQGTMCRELLLLPLLAPLHP